MATPLPDPQPQARDPLDTLRAAYAAFNRRDIDAALALMTEDVEWPRAFKGGFVRGKEAVRAYWTEQWREIDPHVTPAAFHVLGPDIVLAEVRQIVRHLGKAIVADEYVQHRFTLDGGAIAKMDVVPVADGGKDGK